jgi:hypothetical protein
LSPVVGVVVLKVLEPVVAVQAEFCLQLATR